MYAHQTLYSGDSKIFYSWLNPIALRTAKTLYGVLAVLSAIGLTALII